MESTFILVSQNNSDLKLLGLNVAPASYQLINTVVTIIGGGIMIKLYPKITKFYIPYQFATGIVLASLGVASIYMGFKLSDNGIISGNYIGLSYLLIAISELLVVSISMCMVAIYCHPKMIAFAMGAVYVAIGLSSSITGLINKLIAMPTKGTDVLYRAEIYENYFKNVTILCFISAAIVAVGMCVLVRYMKYKKLDFA
jgi:POT family proton-dependent oligopeptide transporter